MDKKNSVLSERRYTRVKDWTPPTYHKGKESYVDFYAFDPGTGGMKRKKVMLGRFRSHRERNAYAKQLMEELTQKLVRGWNPFVEAKAGQQFTSWPEVCTKYRQYVNKMFNDSAYREDTLREYLSRLKMLEGWVVSSGLNIFYPYQLDEYALAKFMDYILIERNCSTQTYNNYLSWIRTFCGWMKQRRYIHDDPTDGLHSIKRTTAKNRTVIPDDVLVKVRNYLEEHNKHFLLAAYILHYMFVRPKEMSKLLIGDFHIEKKTLVLHGEQTKNRQSSVVTLPDHIVKLMIDLKVFDYPSQYYLFSDKCMPGKGRRDEKQFRDYWNLHVRKDLRLPACYKFYSLKDTGITNMLRANTDPLSVRDQARHSSLLITNTYTPLDIKEANPLILKYRGVF